MYQIAVTVVAIMLFVGCLLLVLKGGYVDKIFVKLGLKQRKANINWAVFSWDSCIKKLDYEADVAFFGDSLTRGGDFQNAFCNKKIINLGMSGDTLAGMVKRVSMLESVSPEKVFFLGGINGLTDFNVKLCVEKYEELILAIKTALPKTQIYLQSLLPISHEKEGKICKNKTVEAFNSEIKILARKHGLEFIDLYPLYLSDGQLNPELTVDGLHLKPEGYGPWYKKLKEHM